MPTVNGLPLLSATITEPYLGAWHADLDVDADEALSGRVDIEIGGQVFVGAVLRSGSRGGRASTRVVGGAGGLSRVLPARHYVAPQVQGIIRDALGAAGEALSSTADATTLSRKMPQWQRRESTVGQTLQRLADAVQASWRVLRDGTVWIGPATWPQTSLEHTLVDDDWAAGVLTIAYPEDIPALQPGVVFLAHRIEQVTHRLSSTALRSEAQIVSSASALQRFLGGIRQGIDYSRPYPCRVSKQNADGTLELVPDDPVMKGSGLDRVPIRYPAPGMELKVAAGARCMLEFEAGDPARPFVESWSSGAITELKVVPSGLPAGRQGDMVAVTIVGLPNTATGAPPGSFVLAPPGTTVPPGVPLTAYGVISSGNPIVKT